MNQELRKDYNKSYYLKNKKEILQKACKKIQCEFCQRFVISNNFHNHQTTDICKRRQHQIFENKKRLSMFNEII